MMTTLNSFSLRTILACSFGNILEWYDFTIYAYLAPVLAPIFFVNSDPTVSLMLAYSVFVIGFLIRPVGAIFFGHLGDRIGRKKVLIISISIMAAVTCLIGFLPTFEHIGIYAPLLLILLRMIQGFTVGGESTAASSLVLESTQPTKRGLATALVWSSSGVGMLLSSFTYLICTLFLTTDQITHFGWRIPFLLGAFTGLIGLFLRNNLAESTIFAAVQSDNLILKYPLLTAFIHYKTTLILAIGLYVLSSISTYLLFVYMPIYVNHVTPLPLHLTLAVNTFFMAISSIFVASGGYVSDRLGREIVLLFSAISMLIFAYPLFYLINQGGLIHLIIAQLIFTLIAAGYQGAITYTVLELFPTNIRYSASAFSYNFSYSLFGATAPLMAVYLMSTFNNHLAPSYYLIAGAVTGTVAVLSMRQCR